MLLLVLNTTELVYRVFLSVLRTTREKESIQRGEGRSCVLSESKKREKTLGNAVSEKNKKIKKKKGKN